jgi:hypothetical protein
VNREFHDTAAGLYQQKLFLRNYYECLYDVIFSEVFYLLKNLIYFVTQKGFDPSDLNWVLYFEGKDQPVFLA